MSTSSLHWGCVACIFVLVAGLGESALGANDPVLYFSDITSGPRTGNSDVSLGQVPGQHGAIVTVWGRNLGSPGTAIVTCNGAQAAHYYVQGNATQPANLYSYHRMELISFQISSAAQDGPGFLYVVANGKQSNSLPFTVRSGKILFVKTTGNDLTGTGTWANPWRTIVSAKDSIAPGDIVYVCNGVQESGETEYGACVNLGTNGEPGKPKALIVYPGATVSVGNDSLYYAFQSFYADTGGTSHHWVIAKFTIRTAGVAVPAQTGFRVVGNAMTAPNGDGADAAITMEGDSVVVVGNELDNVGKADCDKLYHGIYGKGYRTDFAPRAPTESEREVGWNYIHECQSDRAIDVYSEQPFSAFIQRHRIHDNVIIHQHGDGILLGYYVVGENWIYNNLIVRAGLGPEFAGGEGSSHAGIRLDCGHESGPATTVYCYNNTIVGCGWAGAIWQQEESGHLFVSTLALSRATTVDFRNNIVLSTGEPYLAGASGTMPSGSFTNCWYGVGNAPAWDVTARNVYPMFVDTSENNFGLTAGSPCVNAGQDLSATVKRDLLGIPRPQGASFDLGAYEYEPVASVDPDDAVSGIPSRFYLLQAYPNPFNPHTVIGFGLPGQQAGSHGPETVTLQVFDLLGREVATLVHEMKMPGSYMVTFDGSGLASGVYIYTLTAGRYVESRTMLLLR